MQQPMMNKIGIWLRPKFNKIEQIFAILAFIGFLAMFYGNSQMGFLFNLSTSFLAIIYFINSYNPYQTIKDMAVDQFITKLFNWSICLVLIGIDFTIHHWKGGRFNLSIGILSSLSIVIAILIRQNNSNTLKHHYKPILIRIFIYSAIGIMFLYFSWKGLLVFN